MKTNDTSMKWNNTYWFKIMVSDNNKWLIWPTKMLIIKCFVKKAGYRTVCTSPYMRAVWQASSHVVWETEAFIAGFFPNRPRIYIYTYVDTHTNHTHKWAHAHTRLTKNCFKSFPIIFNMNRFVFNWVIF